MRHDVRWAAFGQRYGILAAILLAGTTRVAQSQSPVGADRLGPQAVAESLTMLRSLRERVTKQYRDPAAWFQQGMIAWALNERCRHLPHLANLDCTRTRMLADSALMIAGELDPQNVAYTMAFNQFLLTSEVTFRREVPYLDRLLRSSLEHMKKFADPIAHADAAIDFGRLYWLRYDSESHRYWESAPTIEVMKLAIKLTPDSLKIDGNPRSYTRLAAKQARNKLDTKLEDPEFGFWGEHDYDRAEALFREAYTAAPTYLRAYRNYAILIGERNRWPELRELANSRLAQVPGDGWAWMTLGLSYYRIGQAAQAQSAFDSAQLTLSDDDKKRILRIERVLGPRERAAYVHDGQRFEETYWAMADPLWSRGDADPHLEFLARVAYAELLWSNTELSQHGVDSDRGATYIRTGPPDAIFSDRNDLRSRTGSIFWAWDYCSPPPRQCGARFDRIPKYITSSFADDTAIAIGRAPAWDYLVTGRIDTMPAQFTRFRAAADSVDLYFATLPPIDAIARASEVRGPVRTDFWLKTERLELVSHDSVLSSVPGLRAFTRRVSPGVYVYSAEATGESALLGARSRSRIVAGDDHDNLFTLHGFGMSDVLLATRALPRTPQPARWTDIDAAPLLGPIHKNDQIALIWEVYGLAPANGDAQYDVGVIIQPDRAGPRPVSIGARIVGALGVQRRVIADGVESSFSRTLPYRATLVDNIAVSVGDTPPGVYRVTVTVTDRANGASTFAVRRLVIVPGPPTPR